MNGYGRRSFCSACAGLLLGACADVKLPTSFSDLGGGQTKGPTLDKVGELPPPPSRNWPDAKADLDTARADGWGLVSSPDMESYLNGLLATIKKTAGTPGYPGSVHLIGDPSLNANSSAGGNIFVSMGWIQMAESEDEMFAILSHEFGHIYLNHHALYDVKTAGETTATVVSVAWSLANKTPNAHAWSGIDNIAVIETLGTRVMFPAWKRSIEEQADRFGATISLRCGYSYVDGFKTFLERIASYDEQARANRAKLRDEQAKVARDKATRDADARSRAQTVPGLNAGAAQLVSVGGLSQAVASYASSNADLTGQVFDIQYALENEIADQMEKLHDDHGDPKAREASLRELVRPIVGNNMPDARVAPWNAVRKRSVVTQQITHYSAIGDLQGAQAGGQYAQALQLAQMIASGATADDALPVFLLANSMSLAGSRQSDAQLQVLMRNLNARERSWQIQTTVASRMAARDPNKSESFLLGQFDYFGKASVAWPGLISYYRERGNLAHAKELAQTCSTQYLDMASACTAAATPPRQKEEEHGIGRAKELLERVLPKNLF
ncbi:M48 family metallopeptidase [Paraburkholderia lycopersici]|uniref:Putative Zn-dependent protease, contains TPR repeats n=1 Tax=Paraburkholderia lycopersici TaxID=416944 RepID=A0A1G6GJA1_9BURK|nr:M48 family metallopeptidase [Paraburkholderia lycopersici]SDB82091.1 Putative Zn-dependent protease, contains TPR repeats [Paraburkholderia lycopersici]